MREEAPDVGSGGRPKMGERSAGVDIVVEGTEHREAGSIEAQVESKKARNAAKARQGETGG